MKIPESRSASFAIICIVYLAATIAGVATFLWANTRMGTLQALFFSDFVATVLTWAGGLLYRNVSVYDPYWSVAPPVILSLYAAFLSKISLSGVLLLIAVWTWAIRLTANWAITFKGLLHEDWRYTQYRNLPGFVFQTINFAGLNMMPTVVVFLAMIPAVRILEQTPNCTVFTWIGFAMCLCAVLIQYLADSSSHKFRRDHKGEICKVGLWKHGRHPNYFGEILMWWGVWVQSAGQGLDLKIAGAVCITLLFLTVSIPMMEKRQLHNKPGYAQYRKETRILI